jgi:hypothetical protein
VEALLDDLAGHPNIEMKLLEQTVNKAMNGGSRPRHNAVHFFFCFANFSIRVQQCPNPVLPSPAWFLVHER